MRVAEGFVVAEQDVPGVRAPGDTTEVRTTIDGSTDADRLEQRVIRFAPGRSLPRGEPEKQEVLFVVSGSGTLELEGESYALETWTGAFVAPGESYRIDTQDGMVAVSVVADASELGVGASRRVTVRYEDQPVLPASPNREFRYLVNQDAGCLDVTQFVGVIPPGKRRSTATPTTRSSSSWRAPARTTLPGRRYRSPRGPASTCRRTCGTASKTAGGPK